MDNCASPACSGPKDGGRPFKEKNAGGGGKRAVIFGGSFDPVHTEHERIIRFLAEGFDKILVVPGALTPFKLGRAAENPVHRINMLSLALKGISNAEVSDFETKSGGVSYSYLTARHFKELYENLYFAVGADLLPRLTEWQSFSELKKSVIFYVFGREGFKIDENQISALKKDGVKIEFSGFSGDGLSSSLAKASLCFEKQGILNENVKKYIKDNGLYPEYGVIKRAYDTFFLDGERRGHTFRAVKEGILLANIHGEDVNRAVIALLLHDIGKNADRETLLKNGVMADGAIFLLPSKVVHAPLGAEIARQHLGIKDGEILSAIKSHTTGKPAMTKLEMIVFLADTAESGRDFKGVEKLRRLCMESLEKAAGYALEILIESLQARGAKIHKDTFEAFEYYKKVNAAN